MGNIESMKPMLEIGIGESTKKLIQRIKPLESIFKIGLVEQKFVKNQEFMIIESLWQEKQISVFVPKNCALINSGRPTTIISGACMFGGNWGLQIETQKGNKISLTSQKSLSEGNLHNDPAKKLLVDYQIHPAEAENVYRLIEGLSFFTNQYSDTSLSVSFHIPEVEYMLYALDLVKNGKMNIDLYFEACSAIHNRAEVLKLMYSKRLPDKAKINFINPLQKIGEIISRPMKQGVQPGELMDVSEDKVIKIVKNSGWQPESFSELALFSYSAAYWQHFLQAKLDGANTLAVETVEEIKIFSEAKKFNNVFGEQLGILPIYLPPRVFSEQGGDLYWMLQPSQTLPILKNISGAYKNENN